MDPFDIMDMRKPPSRFQRWVKQPASTAWNWTKTTGPSFVRDLPPDLWRGLENMSANSLQMQRVPEENRTSWYSPRWEPMPLDSFGKQMAKDISEAAFLSLGPMGGRYATLGRALKPAWQQLPRAQMSYMVNRWIPADMVRHGIDTGEWAPAMADAISYGSAVGAARGVAALRPYANNRVTRGLTGNFGQLTGALGTGLSAYSASRPFVNKFGGDATDFPLIAGVRRGDYVFDSRGNLVFDPPFGKYPEWDALYRRG